MKQFPTHIYPLDLRKKLHIYDGFEPNDYSQTISLSDEYKSLIFTLAEIINQPFKNLQNILETESFQQLASLQKVKNQGTEWEHFVGSEDLSLYYFIREEKLVLLSFGEFQPARYKVHLESIWRIELENKS